MRIHARAHLSAIFGSSCVSCVARSITTLFRLAVINGLERAHLERLVVRLVFVHKCLDESQFRIVPYWIVSRVDGARVCMAYLANSFTKL